MPDAAILRPDDTQLCGTDGFLSNFLQLECPLDQAGTYAVSVADRNFSQTGDYALSLNTLNPPTAASPIIYGQAVSGKHSPSAEVDFYHFTGSVGDRVFV